MIPRENMIYDIMRKLEKISIGKCLDIRTYKRDRKIVIEKLVEGYNVYEDGFLKEIFSKVSKEELKKLLKVIEKREFPRSNIVRITILESIEE